MVGCTREGARGNGGGWRQGTGGFEGCGEAGSGIHGRLTPTGKRRALAAVCTGGCTRRSEGGRVTRVVTPSGGSPLAHGGSGRRNVLRAGGPLRLFVWWGDGRALVGGDAFVEGGRHWAGRLRWGSWPEVRGVRARREGTLVCLWRGAEECRLPLSPSSPHLHLPSLGGHPASPQAVNPPPFLDRPPLTRGGHSTPPLPSLPPTAPKSGGTASNTSGH